MLPVIFINMTRKVIISIAALSFSFTSETYSKQIIENTNNQFNSVDDYKVNMQVELDVPAFRMPKKKYKVFYKNPNKIKVKAKGFGILPKTGLFTSPNDNFDNLKDIKISNVLPEEDNRIILTGSLIVDSLKLDMPNEYSRITFDPIVEVTIDTTMWVIENVTTKLDTLKLFQINNFYKMYNDNHYMPEKSIVEYYIKDKNLFNWINKDVSNIIGQDQSLMKNNSTVKGTITVLYKDYEINKGLSDKIFD